MRITKASNWRLFDGDPAIITPGRYVRCPPDTLHYPGWHNLGARWWDDSNLGKSVIVGYPLGEVRDLPQTPDRGLLDIPYPPAIRLGDQNCIEFGESGGLPTTPLSLVGGFPQACWNAFPSELPPWYLSLDMMDRQTQATLADILDLMYSDPAAALPALQAYLGPAPTYTIDQNDITAFSGSMIAVTPDYTLVMSSGTSSYEQFALQAFAGLFGPTNYGLFSTNPVWWDNADVLRQRIQIAGADPAKPIILVGHSYGGATVSVLAGRYITGNPARKVTILTFGRPKPGDARLSAILNGATQIHYRNTGDPVPFTPPDVVTYLPLLIGVPAVTLAGWAQFVQTAGGIIIDDVGVATPSNTDIATFAEMLLILKYVLIGGPVPTFSDHSLTEYARRLRL